MELPKEFNKESKENIKLKLENLYHQQSVLIKQKEDINEHLVRIEKEIQFYNLMGDLI